MKTKLNKTNSNKRIMKEAIQMMVFNINQNIESKNQNQ